MARIRPGRVLRRMRRRWHDALRRLLLARAGFGWLVPRRDFDASFGASSALRARLVRLRPRADLLATSSTDASVAAAVSVGTRDGIALSPVVGVSSTAGSSSLGPSTADSMTARHRASLS